MKISIRFAATTLMISAIFVLSAHGEVKVGADSIAKIADGLPAKAAANPKQPRNILIFTKTLGFRHGSIPTGVKAFQMMGTKTRAYTAVHSEDPAMFDADNLKQFDAVIMLNTTGDCLADRKGNLTDEEKSTLEQRKENLKSFIESGKGLVGTHSASDTFYSWKEYGDMIGGWFTSHPWHTDVPLKVDSPNHPLTSMFDPENGFEIKDEIYQFGPRAQNASYNGYQPYSRDALRVLLSLDNSKFDVSRGARSDNDYAISWIRDFGKGRVFYTVLGHNNHIFWNPTVLQHYLAGIQFALGDLDADTTPSGSLDNSTTQTTTIEPFRGNNLDGWKLKRPNGSHWQAGSVKLTPNDPSKLQLQGKTGQLVNLKAKGVDIFTEENFGDCRLELEVMVPKGSNSGIYLHGNYEVQVLDSFGREKIGAGDIGGIYGAEAPRVNAAKAPGEWQTFLIDFQAPRFEGGKKVANAIFKRVLLNGQLIQENVEVKQPTGGNLGQGEAATGPLMFQGDHGAVAYRNIKLTVPAK
ncbi:MAG: DUF1080 domain-containing protein [Planctomycetaceae bacterium]|nr:DUF1080 domain-containing protein [Planctomycetaceae bacterium]